MGLTPDHISTRSVHPLRYIQWSHTTPTLVYMVSLSSNVPSKEVGVHLCDFRVRYGSVDEGVASDHNICDSDP